MSEKKKTVAIYGDSYADDKGYRLNHLGETIAKWQYYSFLGPSYIELLEQDFEIIRYGKEGSSLYYSLKIFEETHHQYDHVIFHVTEPGRFEIHQRDYNFDSKENIGIFGPNVLAWLKKTIRALPYSKFMKTRNFLKYLEDFYFVHIWKNRQQWFEHRILRDKIIRLRPDALILDGFSEDGNKNNLDFVQRYENSCWGVDHNFWPPGSVDIRKCHMSEENHKVLYDAVYNFLKNSKKFELAELPWQCPQKPADYYLRK
jgi:hypothetical protein